MYTEEKDQPKVGGKGKTESRKWKKKQKRKEKGRNGKNE